jgi:hypothetical protein
MQDLKDRLSNCICRATDRLFSTRISSKGGNASQSIPNKWDDIRAKVQAIEKDFQWLSIKYLRKTGTQAMSRIVGDEVASLYDSHGDKFRDGDKLLKVYRNPPYGKMFAGLDQWGQELAAIFAETIPTAGHRGSV